MSVSRPGVEVWIECGARISLRDTGHGSPVVTAWLCPVPEAGVVGSCQCPCLMPATASCCGSFLGPHRNPLGVVGAAGGWVSWRAWCCFLLLCFVLLVLKAWCEQGLTMSRFFFFFCLLLPLLNFFFLSLFPPCSFFAVLTGAWHALARAAGCGLRHTAAERGLVWSASECVGN